MNKSKLPVIKKPSHKGDPNASIELPRSTTYLVDSQKPTPSKPSSTQKSNPSKPLAPINKEGTFTKSQPTSKAPPPQVDSPNKSKSMSLAMLKQQKRAELRKAQATGVNIDDDVMLGDTSNASDPVILTNQKSVESKLKEARKSGQLNLSNYGLSEVPDNVWFINERNEADNDGSNWWDQANLTKLILASNKLRVINRDVNRLLSLVILDIHDNQLESIDESIGELASLQTLNISHNYLTNLPDGVCKLKHLVNFNISFNKISQLPKNIGHLDNLEDFNLSNNCLTSIPKSFGWMTRLRKLNLSVNSLKTLLPEAFYSTYLQIVDLSENQIEALSETVSELGQLDQLFVRQNRIRKLPRLSKCCKLKDLDFSFNQISEIEESWFDNLMSLINLNLRDNRISALPTTIEKLQSIQRLDLSNNSLTNLPCELAAIESLKQLLVEGNPIRTIRRDVINRGTDAIIKSLRMQLEKSPNKSLTEPKSEEEILKSETIKSSKVLDLSGKKLNELTPNMISFCKQSTALSLNLSKNQLADLPNELETLKNQLNELNLAINIFTSLPRPVIGLSNLSTLDLRGNRLVTIPNEISRMTALRELILAENRLTQFPDGIYQLPILETLFLNSNKITTLDGQRIVKMKHLSTLNLQNNDISQVPNELGLAYQIKSLQLEGNLFRVPRPEILAKGTIAVLEYLKSRLSEN